jgi:transcriptional regulator NrdR
VKCPFCSHLEDKVVDSRESKEGEVIRRRRECLGCSKRFTSYERIDQIPHLVVKKDGRRERFDRSKVMAGLLKACEKRSVSMKSLDTIADQTEDMIWCHACDRDSLSLHIRGSAIANVSTELVLQQISQRHLWLPAAARGTC